MITAPDFEKKQIAFVFFKEGDKMAFLNDNFVVKDKGDKIKFQCTCYRLFLIIGVGYTSITSGLLNRAKKFGFGIALFTQSFKRYAYISAGKEGNTLLRKNQYLYNEMDIPIYIVRNKITNQYKTLFRQREKTEEKYVALESMCELHDRCETAEDINSLMAFEGLAAKIYFREHFDNIAWHGRKPRIKNDIVNSVLDIGYTILFSFIESLLDAFGFDLYCGVYHRQFYMRKSLVCDIVEPFRYLIDVAVRKAFNLKQIKTSDFEVYNHQYRLKWECNAKYVSFLMKPLMDNKTEIFKYIQSYYRCFMKGVEIEKYPKFVEGVVIDGNYKL